MKRIVILGAKGTLGSQLSLLYPDAICWDREDVDVLNFPALEARLRAAGSIEAVINCVAFNDVDGAETKPEAAFALNGDYVGRLARFCGSIDIPLVHYSTNYVFDGVAGEYLENDPPSPLSVYGQSKLRGEELAREGLSRHYVIRTAVIFGPKGPSDLSKRSFVELMVDLASKRDTIQAVSDEVNSITYAPDLAAATRDLLDGGAPYGTYHLANEGSASWYEMALKIFEFTERKPTVVPVPGSTFPRAARRPAKAILRNTGAAPLRHWTAALEEFVKAAPLSR